MGPTECPEVPLGYNIPSLVSETGEVLHPLFIHWCLVLPTMKNSEKELWAPV